MTTAKLELMEWGGRYRERGYGIVRLKAGEKKPTDKGWTLKSQSPEDLTDGDNFGLLLGRLSGDLVCVDIDNPELLTLADDHLPATGMVEGRAGRPNAHRYFIVIDIPSGFVADCAGGMGGPRILHYSGLDLLGTGSQAVAPPSIHPKTGERREWVSDDGMPGEPATVPYLALVAAVEALLTAGGIDFESKLTPKAAKPAKVPTAQPKSVKPSKAGAVPKADSGPKIPLPDPLPFDDAVANRAFVYLTNVKSVEGKGGSSALFRACRLLVNDFAFSREESLKILTDWNGKHCTPPWDVSGLERTLDNAFAAGVDSGSPFGGKRIVGNDYDFAGGGSSVPKPFCDPSRLAGEYVGDGDGVTLVHWKGCFYRYTGTHYERLTDDSVEDAVRRFCNAAFDAEYQRAKLAASDAEDGKGKKPSRKPVTFPLVREVVLELRSNHSLPDSVTMPSMLDGSKRTVVACRNGLLDLSDGEPRLLAHTPRWFSSSVLPFDFDADAKDDPTFVSSLKRWFGGNAERVAIAQEWAGYLLSGSFKAEKYLFLLGSGRNGKSSFSAMLQALVGPANCSHIGWSNLDDRFVLSQAQGRLLNISDDIDDIERQPEGRIKELVTGQDIFLETKGKDGHFAAPTVRLIVCGNKIPRVADQSDGLRRRQLLIRFDGQVPASSVRPGMNQPGWWSSNANMAATLNWAVAGLQRLRGDNWRFTVSALDEAILDDHKGASDPLGLWIEERVIVEPGASVTTENAYADYRDFSANAGHNRLLSRPIFASTLVERWRGEGVEKKRVRNGRGYCNHLVGVRLGNPDAGSKHSEILPFVPAA